MAVITPLYPLIFFVMVIPRQFFSRMTFLKNKKQQGGALLEGRAGMRI
jgi:hypothetical protein